MAMHGIPQGIVNPPRHTAGETEHEHHRASGTLLLVFVFLLTFVVYYFVNWKLLSFIWKIG